MDVKAGPSASEDENMFRIFERCILERIVAQFRKMLYGNQGINVNFKNININVMTHL
jgi:hypothetical protein